MTAWASKHGSPPIVEFWTNIDSKMAVATGALRSEIRRENPEERIVIDPVPIRTDEQTRSNKTLVAWHFQNARTRKVKLKFEDGAEEAFVVRKDRPASPQKIDSVPSAVLARGGSRRCGEGGRVRDQDGRPRCLVITPALRDPFCRMVSTSWSAQLAIFSSRPSRIAYAPGCGGVRGSSALAKRQARTRNAPSSFDLM